MLGQLVHRLQSFSPITSPSPSPVSSPKSRRKFGKRSASRSRRMNHNQEAYRDVQSEPELGRDEDQSFNAFGIQDSSSNVYCLQNYSRRSQNRSKHYLKVHRLEPYDRYLQEIHKEVSYDPETIDHEYIGLRTKEICSRKEKMETDLDRIQDLFPNDNLRLYSTHATPVGLQIQDRHVFLFNDLLLIAKARSGGYYKLKEKVKVSDIWLSGCVDEVAVMNKCKDTSFVIGWPLTNVVASFTASATKELWYNKLLEMISAEILKEPQDTTIQVCFYDQTKNIEYLKTLSIHCTTTVRECIRMALDHLEMKDADPSQFRLWVRVTPEDAPYQLIGHEHPFAIKMSAMRPIRMDVGICDCPDSSKSFFGCSFTLRNVATFFSSDCEETKKKNKAKKTPIMKVFRRPQNKADVVDGMCSMNLLYGHPLSQLCQSNEVPKPVMIRELKEKLNTEFNVELENVNVFTLAALLKDFFRSLPDCLLGSNLYDEWTETMKLSSKKEKICRIQSLLSKLDQSNVALLQHFLCVLYHIASHSYENMMTASNLAVCVGPSLLWPRSGFLSAIPEASKHVPILVEFLINSLTDIFGTETLYLFGKPPAKDPSKHDSGAEESDGHNFFAGIVKQRVNSDQLSTVSGCMRRDDSSLDSLEKEFLGDDPEGFPRKDKMSFTNLSRDSGLTLSDCQLYTPDEEESSSSASNLSSSGHGSENPSSVHYGALRYSPPDLPIIIDEFDASVQNSTYVDVAKLKKLPVGKSLSYDIEKSSEFQRHDWFRKRSNVRRTSHNGVESYENPLVRSVSEESVSNRLSLVSNKRPALHGKGPAPLPPYNSNVHIHPNHRIVIETPSAPNCSSGTRNSFSNNLPTECQYSQSSTPLDEVDHSYDSSTLSDDDSTPQVSRSNSRGREFLELTPTNTLCRTIDSSLGPDFDHTGSESSVQSTSVSDNCSRVITPPSYEETMSRRSLFRAHSVHSILESAIRDAEMSCQSKLRLPPLMLNLDSVPSSLDCNFFDGNESSCHSPVKRTSKLLSHCNNKKESVHDTSLSINQLDPLPTKLDEPIYQQMLVSKKLLSRAPAHSSPLKNVAESQAENSKKQNCTLMQKKADKKNIQTPEKSVKSFVTSVEVKSRVDGYLSSLSTMNPVYKDKNNYFLSRVENTKLGGCHSRFQPHSRLVPKNSALRCKEISWSVAELASLFSDLSDKTETTTNGYISSRKFLSDAEKSRTPKQLQNQMIHSSNCNTILGESYV